MRKIIYTIAKKTFYTGTSWKAPVSRLTIFASICFMLAIMGFASSIARDQFYPIYPDTENRSIVLVNTPDSFYRFAENHRMSNAYLFVDGGSYNAYYDFSYINKLMLENNSYMSIVFPEDFDAKVYNTQDSQKPQILTYFDLNDSYAHIFHNESYEEIEFSYNYFLLEELGIPALEHRTFHSSINDATLSQADAHDNYFLFSKMFAPLIIFILILFVCMESGVAVIAGEKEKGTFARLLLTPTKRIHIVIGHVFGVFMRALMIPIIILLIITVFTKLNLLSALAVLGVVISLTFIISALIILISVMGKNTLSAQTAFLPIFLILLMVCVVSMQSHVEPSYIYYILPFFGHYNTMTSNLLGTFSVQPYLLLNIISILSGIALIFIAERLLRIERFTVLADGESGRKVINARKAMKKEKAIMALGDKRSIFDYRIKRIKGPISTVLYHFWFPIAALSFFQFLSILLPIRSFMKLDASSDFLRTITEMIQQYRIEDLSEAAYELMSVLMQQNSFLISMSLGYAGMILMYVFIVKVIEKNDLKTLGFPLKSKHERFKALINYGKGFLIGMLMISGIYLFLYVFGQVKPVGIQINISSLGLLFAYIIMWIPQGAAEEVMMRGYMMPRIAARLGKPAGVFLSSLLFSLLHAGNPGFNVLAFINLILISFFFAWIALRTQEIFTVCAAHTAWNFTQGNVLGMTVSGSTGAATILDTQFTTRASDLLTGGSFGPEGGLAVTVVTLIGLLILFFSRKRQSKNKEETSDV